MRQFGIDREYTGNIFDIVDPTLVTHTGRDAKAPCHFQKSGLSAVGTAASFSVSYLCGFSAQTHSNGSPSARR
jgi:hypothetical protein